MTGRCAWLVFALVIVWAARTYALEARIVEVRIIGQTVRVSLELRDALPDKLRQILQTGGALHVRVQAELWEDRPLWDRLVRPALVSVFRIARDPTTSQIAISDAVGQIMSAVQLPDPISLRVDVAPADTVADDSRYYARLNVTIGTIAEREIEETGTAVFGQGEGSVGLGRVGKLIFNAVLQASDYLQSVSAEARSSRFRKSEILR